MYPLLPPRRRPCRSIAEISAYAARLHEADPACTEPVPVNEEEDKLFITDVVYARNHEFLGLGKRILGHPLKIL